jgi:hypothetical protein
MMTRLSSSSGGKRQLSEGYISKSRECRASVHLLSSSEIANLALIILV